MITTVPNPLVASTPHSANIPHHDAVNSFHSNQLDRHQKCNATTTMRLLSAFVLAATLLSAQANPPQLLRSLKFQGFAPISAKEILRTLKANNVKLAVETPYDQQNVDSAVAVLTDLLTQKGKPGAQVKASTTPVPPHSVDLTFTALTK
jgi:outer membrane protein assembly factor BamA